MPGRTLDVLFLSGFAGLVLLVCSILSGAAAISSLLESPSVTDSISDISARKMSPRH
jgi:hypothetical protein